MPQDPNTLEAQLLQRATSIGPDVQREQMNDRKNWKLGEMPIGAGTNLRDAIEMGIPHTNPDPYLSLGRGIETMIERHGPDWMKNYAAAIKEHYSNPMYRDLPKSLVDTATAPTRKLITHLKNDAGVWSAGRVYDAANGLYGQLPSLLGKIPPSADAPRIPLQPPVQPPVKKP